VGEVMAQKTHCDQCDGVKTANSVWIEIKIEDQLFTICSRACFIEQSSSEYFPWSQVRRLSQKSDSQNSEPF
jgi:hypothetical protein